MGKNVLFQISDQLIPAALGPELLRVHVWCRRTCTQVWNQPTCYPACNTRHVVTLTLKGRV